MTMKIRREDYIRLTADLASFWCPGCDHEHTINRGWTLTFTDDPTTATVTPSILERSGPEDSDICHSFLTDGVWRFSPDSTHRLAGLNAAMVPFPDGDPA